MARKITLLFFVLVPFLFSSFQKNGENRAVDELTLYESVDKSVSNINFANHITVDLANGQSLFDYDYFYNGGGVGIADVNNDGLQDIFFCGNQVPNKLYLNEGGLKFKDITQTSNINTKKDWSNGVTFADVNNDGWLDIYISQGGPLGKNRKNLLFLNMQNATFKELAETYGLADEGISTQSVFFDYDMDGDLDCLVMNENPLYGVQPQVFYKLLKDDPSILPHTTSRLYQNRENKFYDVTKEAGLLKPTFGLGLMVNDINNDGWLDIYISNDYYIPDMIYINQQNGTFVDQVKQYTNHTSFYGMGVDMADINNDGQEDIFGLDMASQDHFRSKTLMPSMNSKLFDLIVEELDFQYQYMYNALQISSGINKYHNVAHLAGVAQTDWSWAGLLADFDNDEDRDIYVTNGYRKYGTNNDFLQRVKKAEKQYEGKFPLSLKKELYQSMPSEKLVNYAFENQGALSFANVSSKWGFVQPSFSNGVAYGDLDNDGDLELVVNNIDQEAFLFKNLAIEKKVGNFIRLKFKGNLSESFAQATIKYNGKMQSAQNKRVRGYLSACEDILHFGLGTTTLIDTIIIEWPSGKRETRCRVTANTIIEFEEKNAAPQIQKRRLKKPLFTSVNATDLGLDYKHSENKYNDFKKEILLPYKQSTLGPFMAKGDLNGDHKEDLFIGGAKGQPAEIYYQQPQGFAKIYSEVLEKDRGFEDMEALIFDFDKDGDNDIYVVSGGNEHLEDSHYFTDRIYLNDGKGKFSKSSIPLLDSLRSSGKAVAALDYDQDGFTDLIVANRIIAQHYPKPASSYLLRNIGGQLIDVTAEVAPELSTFGMINQVIVTDFNGDDKKDFIVVGEWTGIGFFRNNNNGTFKNVSKDYGLESEKGWWFTIGETDINNDGRKDYLVGNLGLNSKYHASKEKPLKVFADDFDQNGTLDIVLSYKYNGNDVPLRGKECSAQQMPFIADKFDTFEKFAIAPLTEILNSDLVTSYQLEATEFRSLLLVNKGNGKFEKMYLPPHAQMFPVLCHAFKDLNGDGFEDVILAGNIYNTEIETPRLDAGTGLVLTSNGKNNYEVKNWKEVGLYIAGNTKELQFFHHEFSKEEYLIALKNNDAIALLKIRE